MSQESLIYADLVSPAFASKVRTIAARLGIDPNWLMAVMAFETGYTFSPSIRNRETGAVGLIQFLADTKKVTGFTKAELAQQDALTQLDSVERYFRFWIDRVGTPQTFEEAYMLVHGPALMRRPHLWDERRRRAVALAKKAYEKGFRRAGVAAPTSRAGAGLAVLGLLGLLAGLLGLFWKGRKKK